jgi:hypothetical protein
MNRIKFITITAFLLLTMNTFSQDSNFYIFLCFGQSNMEGQGIIEEQDKIVNDRFQVLQAVDCTNPTKTKGTWRTAVPPTSQCGTGLSVVDVFGKTMVEKLPDSIKIGIVNVAVGGCDIRLFDKNLYKNYQKTYTDAWFTDKVKLYNGNPYLYLINLAKIAQQKGVIKGILLHQGETNTGDTNWPYYVKTIYNNMMTDLSLNPNSVPLLAGELVSTPNSCCSSMNTIINTLPEIIPTAHIISSSGCTAMDKAHFDSEGYRKLGKRYADEMLFLLGY